MSAADRLIAAALGAVERRMADQQAEQAVTRMRAILADLDLRDPETGPLLARLLDRVRDGIRAAEARGALS